MKLFKLITLVILTSSFITLGGCYSTVATHKADTSYLNNQLKYIDIKADVHSSGAIYITVKNNSNKPFKLPYHTNVVGKVTDNSNNVYILDRPDSEVSGSGPFSIDDRPDYLNPGYSVEYQRWLPRIGCCTIMIKNSDIKKLSLNFGNLWQGDLTLVDL